MIEIIALLLWTLAVGTACFHAGRTEGYAAGLDDAATMIFGLPVVWP